MINRKILYGYLIQNGELTIHAEEAMTVKRIITLYLEGLSYQKIADTLNADHVPFSSEVPAWNKHKVKRLLANPRYTGTNGYPPIIESGTFQAVQRLIQTKNESRTPRDIRSVLKLKEHLCCAICGGSLFRTAGQNHQDDTLYLKCDGCGVRVTILDADLLNEVNRQMAERNKPADSSYTPSGEVIRLANAINRGLEHPDKPEEVISLILQGISARYDCCPATENEFHRLVEADFKGFDRVVSHISISREGTVTVYFK